MFEKQTIEKLLVCKDPDGYGEDCGRRCPIRVLDTVECTKYDGGCNRQMWVTVSALQREVVE